MAKLKTTSVDGNLTVQSANPEMIVKNTSKNDSSIILDRNGNANWRIRNNSGYLRFESDYTTAKGEYYEVASMSYNSGNMALKGNLTVSNGKNVYHEGFKPTADEVGAVRGARLSGDTAATAGWYRIAQTGTDVGNNTGMFMIRASASGKHSSTILTVGITYGQNPTIQQLSHTQYSTSGITKARIVYHTTHAGTRAYLEVYIPDATARTIEVQLTGTLGWSLLNPSTAGSVPSGYSNKEITLATNKIVSDINGTINGYTVSKSVPSDAVFTDTKYNNATTSAHGLMSNTDKSKLDGIATGANKYTHPTGNGNNHIPSNGSSNQFLKYSSAGTATWSGLPSASASASGIVQLNNTATSTSTTQAATANALKLVNDEVQKKQTKYTKMTMRLAKANTWYKVITINWNKTNLILSARTCGLDPYGEKMSSALLAISEIAGYDGTIKLLTSSQTNGGTISAARIVSDANIGSWVEFKTSVPCEIDLETSFLNGTVWYDDVATEMPNTPSNNKLIINKVDILSSNQSIYSYGFTKLDNGLIIQWGNVEGAEASGQLWPLLPIAFPNGFFGLTATFNSMDQYTNEREMIYYAKKSGDAQIVLRWSGNLYHDSIAFTDIYWIAWGY